MKKSKINYWIFNYEPKWEAASKEVALLLESDSPDFKKNLVALNLKNRKFKLKGNEKFFPLPFSLLGLPWVKYYASSFEINHLFASSGEQLLIPILSKIKNSILTITKDSATALFGMGKNIDHLKSFEAIIVESRRHYETIKQTGVARDRLYLVYPGVDVKEYVPATGKFKIFFASSPSSRNDFLSRGIHLLLKAAQKCPEVEFILAWRENHYKYIKQLIEDEGLHNVAVKNGFIKDIEKLYRQTHATILPGLAAHSFKPCPHSIIESLGHGKPVLVTQQSSITDIIEEEKCGLVFEPEIDSLVSAIKSLKKDYEFLQQNCHKTAVRHFSKKRFLSKYIDIYNSLS